jgi:hypothetical protein
VQVSCSPMARALLQSIPGDGLDFTADPMFPVAHLLEAAPLPIASQPLAPNAQDMVRALHRSPYNDHDSQGIYSSDAPRFESISSEMYQAVLNPLKGI